MQSADINSITSVKCWEGIDLRWFNTLQDTTSMVFTKQYGFRFSSCEYRGLADKQGVLSVDFGADAVGIWRTERRVRFQVRESGTVHAIMASWEVYASDKALVMSTHPDATLHNFPRDMQRCSTLKRRPWQRRSARARLLPPPLHPSGTRLVALGGSRHPGSKPSHPCHWASCHCLGRTSSPST